MVLIWRGLKLNNKEQNYRIDGSRIFSDVVLRDVQPSKLFGFPWIDAISGDMSS